MSATGVRAASAAGRLADALRALVAGRAAAGPRSAGGRPAPSLRRSRPRALIAAAAALVLALAGWFWLRDSSLVAVRTVQVTGVPGPQGSRIREALAQAARSMTTLHVRRGALETAVAPFSLVKRIEVSTSFPHTMRIHVVTNVAVGVVVADGRAVAVTSDGTLLRDVAASSGLAQIQLRSAPAGPRLTDPAAVAAVDALGAAPAALQGHVQAVRMTSARGLTLQLAHGPLLIFGTPDRLGAKWAAAAAVLGDPQAAGASTIDVSAPGRPAVAGLSGGAPVGGASDLPTLPSGPAGTVTTPAAPTVTAPPANPTG